jgi:hypothetical protein
MPAINAMTRNVTTQLNMVRSSLRFPFGAQRRDWKNNPGRKRKFRAQNLENSS